MEINGVTVFKKDYTRDEMMYQFKREKAFLCALHPYHGFPKILGSGRDEHGDFLYLSHCGGYVDVAGVSLNIVRMQLNALIDVLGHVGIKHRDITRWNMLWHPTEGLYLIDFGLSIWQGEEDVVPDYSWTSRWEMCELTDREHAFITMHELETGHVITEDEWNNDWGQRWQEEK
jgi:hypothetical protein